MDKAGVVYQIECKDCEASYVGQTGRHLRDRIKEHSKALEKGNIHNSGVAEHAFEAHHDVDMDNIHVLDTEANQSKRLVREALGIRDLEPTMNRDRGIEVPLPLLKLVPKTHHRGRHPQTNDDQPTSAPGPQKC